MNTLSYRDRIALLREKKIEHTLQKKEQQGYMDSDDYGTIPKPEGYSFEPIPNEGKDYFHGAMGNAVNFKKFLENHPIYVDPLEIMCGRWADMLSAYRAGGFEKTFPYDELKKEQVHYGVGSGIGADTHFACDYTIGLKLGFSGFLKKIRKYKEINPEKQEFYNAEEIVVVAMIDFIETHIGKIKTLIETETRYEILESLREMLAANEHIKENPPENFLQACQWIAWFNTISRMYDRDGAGCGLDVILYPYYAKDIENGLIDDEKATFILANLLLIETHYYQLSGADKDDNDLTNPVSYLILDAAHWLNTSANLTIRIHDNIDPKFLRKGVSYLFTDRNAWPRFSGDKGLMNYQKNKGITKEIARQRVAVGCNWMAVPGKEYPMNDCIKINVAKLFEISFTEMMEGSEQSVDILMEILMQNIKTSVDITAKGILFHLAHQQFVLPELVMNLMMEDTIEKGEDISVCAQLKTIGIDGVGLGTVADSFAAIEQRLQNEKRISFEELYVTLQNNFEGVLGERTRLMLSKSERYCQGNSLGDKWAKKISETFDNAIHSKEMPNNIQLIAGWFSWSNTIIFGQQVGATPDGRFASAPVTHGANPNPGFRVDSAATAMATGIADIQTQYGNPCPFQIELDPKLSIEQGGIERVEQIFKTHVDKGGTLINANIIDAEKLMAAHKDPLLYPDLVVRVTGFTAYFATLSPAFRQLVVDRFIEAI